MEKMKTKKKEEQTKTIFLSGEEEQKIPAARPVVVSPSMDPEKEEVKTEEGPEQDNYIYTNNIYSYVDEFINLEYPGIDNKELKQDKAFFPLLVQYLYNTYIGDLLKNKPIYRTQGIKPNYQDINIIDDLFNIYINLVYKYKWNNKPFIVEFSLFTGINKDTFYNWLNGIDTIYHGEAVSDYLTRERSDAVRKWLNACEQALLNGYDTIRDIFILKSKHGYKDNNNDIQITVNHKALISADNLPDLIGIPDSKQ